MGMLLFLTPVFFPLSVLPDFLQTWVGFNPFAIPIEALRSIGLMGQWPNFPNLILLFGAGVGLAICSAWLFEKSRKGFADVL
jgi:lipopolysaccharide transport system permease protein